MQFLCSQSKNQTKKNIFLPEHSLIIVMHVLLQNSEIRQTKSEILNIINPNYKCTFPAVTSQISAEKIGCKFDLAR